MDRGILGYVSASSFDLAVLCNISCTEVTVVMIICGSLQTLGIANGIIHFTRLAYSGTHKCKKAYWQLTVDDRTKIVTFLESAPRNYPETMKTYSQTKMSLKFVT